MHFLMNERDRMRKREKDSTLKRVLMLQSTPTFSQPWIIGIHVPSVLRESLDLNWETTHVGLRGSVFLLLNHYLGPSMNFLKFLCICEVEEL